MARAPYFPDSLLTTMDLYQAYERYNKKYWKGKLPPNVTINVISPDGKGYIVSLKEGNIGGSGFSTAAPNEPLIELSAVTLSSDSHWKLVLAHEMCHLAVDLDGMKKGTRGKSQHGPRFKEEVRKLARLGFLEEII